MKTIPLTQGKVAIVDDCDYDWLMQWKWHAARKRRKSSENWYAKRRELDGQVLMHRAIAIRAGLPESRQYDHRDTDGLNNQRSNLRPCSHAQNGANRRKATGCSSRFKGLTWRKNRWQVGLKANGRYVYIGRFTDESQAAQAYNQAAKEHFGEFALLNTINQHN